MNSSWPLDSLSFCLIVIGHYKAHTVSNAHADRHKQSYPGVNQIRLPQVMQSFLSIWSFNMALRKQVLHSFRNTTVCRILKKYEVTLQLDKDTTVTEWMWLRQAGKRMGASSVYDLVHLLVLTWVDHLKSYLHPCLLPANRCAGPVQLLTRAIHPYSWSNPLRTLSRVPSSGAYWRRLIQTDCNMLAICLESVSKQEHSFYLQGSYNLCESDCS